MSSPEGFHAHWVRVISDTSTTATAQFTDGPADQRDAFLDWGREQGPPTGAGRAALANADSDQDGLVELGGKTEQNVNVTGKMAGALGLRL